MTLLGQQFQLLQVGVPDHASLLLRFRYRDVDYHLADLLPLQVPVLLDPFVHPPINLDYRLLLHFLLPIIVLVILSIFVIFPTQWHEVLLNELVILLDLDKFLLREILDLLPFFSLLLHLHILPANIDLFSQHFILLMNLHEFLVFL